MDYSVYLETTVISYLTAKRNRDIVIAARQETTRQFWDLLGRSYVPYVSALVISECSKGDPEQSRKRIESIKGFSILSTDSESEMLANLILHSKGIPEQYPEDALHLALAAANGIDFVATWNFAHINNPFTRRLIRTIIEGAGYQCPEIISPDELLGEMS